MEEKIISMYAKGMTTTDIESHMRELYDIDLSDSTISRVTDKVLPIVREWQERPLEEIYAVEFMDAIHYHVRSEGRIVKRAEYYMPRIPPIRTMIPLAVFHKSTVMIPPVRDKDTAILYLN